MMAWGLRGVCVRGHGGCGDGVGLWGKCQGTWGYDHIPFLVDGNYGVMGSWGMR